MNKKEQLRKENNTSDASRVVFSILQSYKSLTEVELISLLAQLENYVERAGRRIEHDGCSLGCPYYKTEHSINASGYCNQGCC